MLRTTPATSRPFPAMAPDDPWTTAEDKRRRKEAIETSFAREPLWGQYFTRMFGDHLKSLEELDRTLVR